MTDILNMTDDDLRALFQELTDQADAIRAKSAPLREARDRHANEARDEELRLNAEIKAVEADLNGIDIKRSRLVKLLGGRTGTPAAAPASDADAAPTDAAA